MPLSSDPHAWLRPIYARLKAEHTFSLLSPSHQFELLRQAVGEHHPTQAAQMGEWSTAAQEGLLLHLAATVEHDTPPTAVSLLWKVHKNGRELRCVAQYLSTGIDVRLLEGFHRTQLCKDAPEANTLAEKWLAALLERGWQKHPDVRD